MTLTDVTKEKAELFCHHCEWVCRCWSMNLAIFKCVSKSPKLLLNFQSINDRPIVQHVKDYLLMGNSHTLVETAKLHDPAVNNQRWSGREGACRRWWRRSASSGREDNENLSIGFFARAENWTTEEWRTIKQIKKALNKFHGEQKIAKWRNKIYAHHDRRTFEERPFSEIPKGKIDDYLTNLGRLADEIWTKWNLGTGDDQRNFDWSPNGPVRTRHQEEAEEVISFIVSCHTARDQ